MNTFTFFISFLLLSIFNVDLLNAQTQVIVSGCDGTGSSGSINGTYTYYADVNSRPAYQYANYLLLYNNYGGAGLEWEIYDTGSSQNKYYNTSSSTTVPTTGWQRDVVNGGTAPTISYVTPAIDNAIYNVNTGALSVTGSGMTTGDIVDPTKLTITGEGGSTYTLTSSNVTASSSTAFSITLNLADQAAVDQILNKNGNISTGGTNYNLAAATNWDATAASSADFTNTLTVSNVAVPTITSAAYNYSSGVLTVTGTGLLKLSGANNDIVANKFTVTGEGGSYTLTNTSNVEITSGTAFSLTLSSIDKTGVNAKLDGLGSSSSGGTMYNLSAAEDWNAGADVAVVIADLSGNGITVSNLNNAPTVSNTPASVTVTEDVASNVDLSSTTFADADGDPLTVTIAASAGTLAASSGGSVTVGGSPAALTLSGTASNINTYLDTPSNIKYTSALNANGTAAATLTITPNDGIQNGNSATVNINITAVNDDPAATGLPSTLTVIEDVSSGLDLSGISFSDPDIGSGNATLTLSVDAGYFALSNPAANSLTSTGNGTGIVTLTGTFANLEAYLNTPTNTSYYSAHNAYGTAAATLTIKINDNGNTGSGGGSDVTLGTVQINITAVNDPPTLTATASDPTFTEGGSAVKLFSGTTVSTVESGQHLKNLTITVTNVDGTSDEFLDFNDGSKIILDNGSSGFTGALHSSFSVSVISGKATIDFTLLGIDSPTFIANWINSMTYYNSSHDPTITGTTRVITITSLSDDGGTANGGSNTASLNVASTVTINAVNDNPSASGIPASISQTEDIMSVSGFSSIVVSDSDAGSGKVTIKFSAESGTMVYAGGTGITETGNASKNVTFTGTIADLNFFLSIATNILYTSAQDVNGTGADHITVILNDNGNTGSGGGTDIVVGVIPINIAAVNDPPVNHLPVAQYAVKNVPLVLSSANGNQISISDVDAGTGIMQTTLTATHGSITLSGTTGLSFGAGTGTNDATMTFSGTMTAINNALNGMTFTPETDYLGDGSLQITTDDNGNSGDGGALSDNDVLTIHVTLPVMAVSGNSTTIVNGDTTPGSGDGTDFGSVNITATAKGFLYSIKNTGTGYLNLTGTPKIAISGPNMSDFSVTINPSSPINASETTSFQILFNPSYVGLRTATVSIESNDPVNSPYTFAIQGTGFDNTPPEAICKNLTVSINDNKNPTITADQIDNGSNDECGILSLELNKTTFTTDDVGENVVILTVTDSSGNESTCSAIVTVTDDVAPEVQCNTMDFVISSDSYYTLTDEDIAALSSGTTDNVTDYEDLDIRVSPGKLTCANEGGTTIKVYATDEAGNENMCMVAVGVTIENSSPVIDSIADVTTDEDVSVSVALSGISSGKICDRATTVTASHNGGSLISDLQVTHTSSEATGTLDIELMANQSGSAEVSVEVANNEGDKITTNFMLTVNPVNDAPVLVQSIPDQGVRATENLEISISKILGVLFNDVDDSTLTYSVRFESGTLPDWIIATDDADVYMLDIEPLQADTGCYTIIIEARDPAGATASDTFELCVDKLVVGLTNPETEVFEVSLYPNPTEGKVTIEHNVGTSDEMEISVMSISGSEVFRKSYRVGEEPVTFNLSDQVSGMYMVLIKVDDNVVIKKLVLDKK